ncbi:MAG: aspartate/glutamate racemase family protein [Alphaproteobacteria bacterium]|mgnify:CR=1 FL=1
MSSKREAPADPSWSQLPAALDDGPAGRAAIGLIVLGNDATIEPELNRILARDGVGVYAHRIALGPDFSVESIRRLEGALAEAAGMIMPDDRLDVVAFGCTSCTMAIGQARVAERIREARPGTEVTEPVSAALAAFKALGMTRIGLLTPYPHDVNKVAAEFLESQGLTVAAKAGFLRRADYDIARVTPDSIAEAAIELGKAAVDGIFISGTGLRASSVIARIEAAAGKPVVASNQALAWHCLRLAGAKAPLDGYGRLFGL